MTSWEWRMADRAAARAQRAEAEIEAYQEQEDRDALAKLRTERSWEFDPKPPGEPPCCMRWEINEYEDEYYGVIGGPRYCWVFTCDRGCSHIHHDDDPVLMASFMLAGAR